MRRLVVIVTFVAALGLAACNQPIGEVTGPSPVGAALTSLSQLAQSTIAVLDQYNGSDCSSGCRVSKWTNAPTEPPSPINFTQGGSEPDGCVQAYGSTWHTTHMYCEEEDTCQPEDSWGLQKLRICAQ
jgi:hypothetical protein